MFLSTLFFFFFIFIFLTLSSRLASHEQKNKMNKIENPGNPWRCQPHEHDNDSTKSRRRKRRQRRRKTRTDRVEAADRGKQQQHQQQRQSSREDDKNSKEWENNNDSWKTIPRDDKNWHRNAMDIWDTSNNESERNENSAASKYPSSNAGRGRRQHQDSKDNHAVKEYSTPSHTLNSDCESSRDKRSKKSEPGRKTDYETSRNSGRSEKEHSRYTNGDERSGDSGRRKQRNGDEERRENSKQNRDMEDSEDEDINEAARNGLDEDSYGTSVGYKENYEGKKYYEERDDGNEHEESSRRYRQGDNNARDEHKYENEKSDSDSTSTDSEDTSTITIPETGRKVEHIAQKLEQTAQKYAREHSPPKFVERRRGITNDSGYKHQQHHHQEHHQGQHKMSLERDEKPPPGYDRTYDNNNEARSRNSQRYEREYSVERTNNNNNNNSNKQQLQSRGNTSSATVISSPVNGTYERTSFAKNPERKRNFGERASSGRRFDNRPRPPFEDAPERPTLVRPSVSDYRERRYSEKEEIYGETSRYPGNPSTMEKDRGYESNFETKLERNKILEKVQQVAYKAGDENEPAKNSQNNGTRNRNPEINDTNNNTLKNERKNGLPRQTTTLGHLAQTGRAFELDTKSPKFVKRTKSFWRFRRDSDVLEGMALWQHRSLVDIPKMLKREASNEESDVRTKENSMSSRKTITPEGSPGSTKSIGKESRSSDNTLTNDEVVLSNDHRRRNRYEEQREQRQDEPKPAERMHVPDKSDYYESDFPTPAERPKLVERSEYRMQREERSLFVGNVSRKAIIEKERKRSLEAKRNMVVAELKENNEAAKGERRNKSYGDDDDGLIQGFSETEASDEESTYSCIIVKDQAVTEKTLLPRTKLRRDSERDKNTCGPWYDLWGVDNSVKKNK